MWTFTIRCGNLSPAMGSLPVTAEFKAPAVGGSSFFKIEKKHVK